MSQKSVKSYWPHFIIGFFLFAATGVVFTVKIALNNPVELDNHYRADYHKVGDNINKILQMSQAFDKKGYSVKMLTLPKRGSNSLKFQILDKSGKSIQAKAVDLLVTRRATTKNDIVYGKLKFINGSYIAPNVKLALPGEWIFNLEVKIENLTVIRLLKETLN
ncbi:MAG: hypothetical protein ACI86H_000361 [bacterium]|jgi:hypothetical protein